MSTAPVFSIVVPTYNRAALIGRTLESLLAQSYAHFELLVVDDESNDDTRAVVAPYLRDERVRYHWKTNGERAAARNYGRELARGDYVNFFDSDDLALPNHLEEAARLISERRRPEWFHLGYSWVDPDGRELSRVDRFRGESLEALLPAGNPLSCNGVFLRRDVATAYPFHEDRRLSASEDYHLWYRLAARYPLWYSNRITSQVVDHDLRSVRVMSGQKLIDRLYLLLRLLQADPEVQAAFAARFAVTRAEVHSYLALHLSEQNRWKIRALVELLRALGSSPGHLLRRRTLATLRNLLWRW